MIRRPDHDGAGAALCASSVRSGTETYRAQGSRALLEAGRQQRNLVLWAMNRSGLQARLLQTQRPWPRHRPGEAVLPALCAQPRRRPHQCWADCPRIRRSMAQGGRAATPACAVIAGLVYLDPVMRPFLAADSVMMRVGERRPREGMMANPSGSGPSQE